MEISNSSIFQTAKIFILNTYEDKPLLLSWIIITLLAISNTMNKILLDWEPLQYSLFSYDKILHLLASLIIVRSIYLFLKYKKPQSPVKQLILISSVLCFILYGILWECFELFTFFIQNSDQLWSEVFDVPFDWLYDIGGIIISYFLDYS